MAKRESPIRDVVKALSILKSYQEEWPAAASSPILRQALAQVERDLLEAVYKIESERKGEEGGTRKKSPKPD